MKAKPGVIAIWIPVFALVAVALVFVAMRLSLLVSSQPPSKTDAFDARYLDHNIIALLHIGSGCVFLLFAPFQFIRSIRDRHRVIHRWTGRLLVTLAILFGVSGLIFGIFWPFGGSLERSATVGFGFFFLFALSKAVQSIRRRRVTLHREWMIRMFSIALGVSVIRIVMGSFFAMTHQFSSAAFGLSFWLGWGVSLATAELWIRRTGRLQQVYNAG